MKELETITPFMWLEPKKSDVKAKVTGIIPAGSDIMYPYMRCKIEFTTGDQLIMKQDLIKMMFNDLELQGTFNETYEQTLEKMPKDDEKEVLLAKAKELGIRSAHLMSIDKLKEKIQG